MPIQYDDDFVRRHYAKMGKPLPKEFAIKETPVATRAAEEPKRTKYGNKKTTVDGKTFDSKHEAERWKELQLLLAAGEIVGILPQVAFALPGGVTYKADFVILNRDGTFRVEDAKSSATAKDKVYRLKKRQMRECLGIEIMEV